PSGSRPSGSAWRGCPVKGSPIGPALLACRWPDMGESALVHRRAGGPRWFPLCCSAGAMALCSRLPCEVAWPPVAGYVEPAKCSLKGLQHPHKRLPPVSVAKLRKFLLRVYGFFTAAGARLHIGIDDLHYAALKEELRRTFSDRFVSAEGNGLVGTVSPNSVEELRDLVDVAARHAVPLLARGAGTSPHVPLAVAGLQVSLRGLQRLLALDPAAGVAAIEPGMTWGALIRELQPQGWMPRVYPSSRAVSTVGGFVAQGGVGVGSFEFGSIRQSVARVRLLTPQGELLEVAGDDLGSVVGGEGRTGLIVEVDLLLQAWAPMEPLIAAFNSVEDVERCLADLWRQPLPVWSIGLMDQAAVSLQVSQGAPVEALPKGRCAALFSFRCQDRKSVLPQLRGSILGAGGRVSAIRGTHDQWIDRFMGLQALATTPVPLQFSLGLGKLRPMLRALRPELRRRLGF